MQRKNLFLCILLLYVVMYGLPFSVHPPSRGVVTDYPLLMDGVGCQIPETIYFTS